MVVPFPGLGVPPESFLPAPQCSHYTVSLDPACAAGSGGGAGPARRAPTPSADYRTRLPSAVRCGLMSGGRGRREPTDWRAELTTVHSELRPERLLARDSARMLGLVRHAQPFTRVSSLLGLRGFGSLGVLGVQFQPGRGQACGRSNAAAVHRRRGQAVVGHAQHLVPEQQGHGLLRGGLGAQRPGPGCDPVPGSGATVLVWCHPVRWNSALWYSAAPVW
jgi:hypothetical protein